MPSEFKQVDVQKETTTKRKWEETQERQIDEKIFVHKEIKISEGVSSRIEIQNSTETRKTDGNKQKPLNGILNEWIAKYSHFLSRKAYIDGAFYDLLFNIRNYIEYEIPLCNPIVEEVKIVTEQILQTFWNLQNCNSALNNLNYVELKMANYRLRRFLESIISRNYSQKYKKTIRTSF